MNRAYLLKRLDEMHKATSGASLRQTISLPQKHGRGEESDAGADSRPAERSEVGPLSRLPNGLELPL